MTVIRETRLEASTDLRIKCLIEIAFMYRGDLNPRLAVEPAALAVITARHFGDPKLLRRALSVLAVVLSAVGDDPGGLRAGCEAYGIALDHDAATAPYVLHNLASVLLEFGCHEIGLDVLRSIAGSPTPAGPSFSAMVWSTHAHGALVLGHIDEGLGAVAASLNDLRDLPLDPDNRRTLCYAHSTRARLLCAAGRAADAAEAVDMSFQFASKESPIELAAARSAAALFSAYQGRRDEALKSGEELLQSTRDDYLAFRASADAVGLVYRICSDEHAWVTLQREHTVYLRDRQLSVMNRARDLYLSRVALVPDTRLPDFVVQGSDSTTLDAMAERASVDEANWLDMAVSMSQLRIEQTHVRPFRVGALATLLARNVARRHQIDPDILGKSARLCDLGMLCLPPALVRPNNMRSSEEHALLGRYSALGSSLLSRSRIAHRQFAESVVRHHTERFDGHGEPDGLRGAAIPFAARLVAVARAIDEAMCGTDGTHRDFFDAVNIVRQRCPLEFDPDLVERLSQDMASAQSVADHDVFQCLDGVAPPSPVVELRSTLRTDAL